MYKRVLSILVIVTSCFPVVSSQKVAVKSNLLTDATASPNLGVEVGLAPKWTLELDYELNGWAINNHLWKHWFVSPEIRLWFCEWFQGSFWGLHLLGGQYNFGNIHNNVKFLGSDFSKLTDSRIQGWAAGAGIGYGYDWVLSDHWNLEFEIGVGWLYTRYSQYPCAECGTAIVKDKPHNYFGPTKLALSLEYLF